MSKPQFIRNIVNYIAKTYGNDPGKMLVHTGVIGWALSSMAQVFAIILNDKIPKKQKLFLIPQEIADACVNIMSFYVITQSCKAIALKVVNSGRWLPSSVKKFLTEKGVENVGKSSFDVLKHGNLTEKLASDFNEFRNGIDVIATTAGSILSCNIVTPVIRNQIAAHRQKTSLSKIDQDANIRNLRFEELKPEYYTSPSVRAFQNASYNKTYNSKGSMTI